MDYIILKWVFIEVHQFFRLREAPNQPEFAPILAETNFGGNHPYFCHPSKHLANWKDTGGPSALVLGDADGRERLCLRQSPHCKTQHLYRNDEILLENIPLHLTLTLCM